MPRWNEEMGMEGMVPKIRKRGCSSSSSTSSRVHHYRFKRAILVGKARSGHHGLGIGLGRSRSTTPVPTWKMSAVESPKYSQSGRSRPVSARRLAATLWEMNEMPTPKVVEKLEESRKLKKMGLKREKTKSGLSGSGSFPPHLSDPSHSPVSERIDRSGTGSRQRRTSAISQRLKPADHSFEVLDSVSSASLMEIETRSRAHISSESVGVKNRLKDVSNALTTSKELLKIINRIWAHADQPSSSMSLVSALHAELERARLLVNQLIQERRSDQNEINYLMKCFAEEKATWKNKEQRAVEAAIESIGRQLEVERKLRQRSESLNKKLGKELAETKASLSDAVKELEGETRAREITEQVCDELAKNIGEDKYKMDELKRESAKLQEEVEKEREMLQLADKLREERVHMKLSEAKHQFEEKNSAINKLRKQLEAFLGKKRVKENKNAPQNLTFDQDVQTRSSVSRFGVHQEDDGGEVEDVAEEDGSAESDLHSIELNRDGNNKSYKWAHTSSVDHDSWRAAVKDLMEGRKTTSLQRSISDVVESDILTGDGLDRETLNQLEKQILRRKSVAEKTERHQSVNGRADQVLLSNPRAGSVTEFSSPTGKLDHSWSSRASFNGVQGRSSVVHGSHLKSRLAEIAGEGQIMRRSKR